MEGDVNMAMAFTIFKNFLRKQAIKIWGKKNKISSSSKNNFGVLKPDGSQACLSKGQILSSIEFCWKK